MVLLKAIKCGCIQFVRRFSVKRPYQEVSVPVPWGEIRGKWWGPTDSRPILSIHGWQDNCGAFDRLIPLLNSNVAFLAIDLPGHGYSSRLPNGMYYYFSNYILTVEYIRRYFKWPKMSLMGHSLGGMTSYVYTMLYPQNVDFVICIDGYKPLKNKNEVDNMAKSFSRFIKNNEFAVDDKEPPSYSIEEIERKIHIPNNGSIQLEVVRYVMERNIAPSKLHPGKYYFTRDPRLKSGALLSFSEDDLREHAQNVTCPIFITKSKESSYYGGKARFYEVLEVLKTSSRDCDFNYVEGTHHVHLNHPEEIATLLYKFIQRHNVEDRSIGGLKPEMIVTEDTQKCIVEDNCGTFDRLIPLLNTDIGFLTIDLPGHGYSSRLPNGLYYHFTTYILTFEYIKKYFQWSTLSLMGHSLGGALSYAYAMMYPQNVDFLICIDDSQPLMVKDHIGHTAKSIRKFLKNNEFASDNKEGPSYTFEEIKKKIYDSGGASVQLEFIHHIMKRNIAPSKVHPGKYYFTRDPRVKSGALLSFPQNELIERAQNITCPIFLAKAKGSLYYKENENYYHVLDVLRKCSQDCDFHYVEGTHHAHLNHPEEIARLLYKFIQRHNKEDRSIGGLKPEIIVSEERGSRVEGSFTIA